MASVIDLKELKNMKPHEEKGLTNDDDDRFGGNRMMKVDGGWIYWRTIYAETNHKDPRTIAGVFVPENVSSPASIS